MTDTPVAWKLLESPRSETVMRSDVDTWMFVVAIALIVGLYIDLVTSGGSTTG